MLVKVYSPVWNKYRPAILRMMVDSAQAPQQYKLSGHEFRALNTRQKRGFNFVMQVAKGRAINNIKDSLVAQDLLEVLQLSRRASEMIDDGSYEFQLDKDFVLHVNKLS